MSIINEHNEIDWTWFCLCGQGVYELTDSLEAYQSIRGLETAIIKEFESLKSDIYQKLEVTERSGFPNPEISGEKYALYGAYRVCKFYEDKRREHDLMEEALTERESVQFDKEKVFEEARIVLFGGSKRLTQDYLDSLGNTCTPKKAAENYLGRYGKNGLEGRNTKILSTLKDFSIK